MSSPLRRNKTRKLLSSTSFVTVTIRLGTLGELKLNDNSHTLRSDDLIVFVFVIVITELFVHIPMLLPTQLDIHMLTTIPMPDMVMDTFIK